MLRLASASFMARQQPWTAACEFGLSVQQMATRNCLISTLSSSPQVPQCPRPQRATHTQKHRRRRRPTYRYRNSQRAPPLLCRPFQLRPALSSPKVFLTLVTSDSRILPALRPALAKKAEEYLAKVGVTAVTWASQDSRTKRRGDN